MQTNYQKAVADKQAINAQCNKLKDKIKDHEKMQTDLQMMVSTLNEIVH